MEATPPPAAQPPPPPTAAPAEETAGGGWRALAVVLALALAFASAVMIVASVDIGETPTLKECRQDPSVIPSDGECFDGGETKKTVSLAFTWPSGVIAGIAAIAALLFAATGRNGRLVVTLTGLAIGLGAAGILIGSV